MRIATKLILVTMIVTTLLLADCSRTTNSEKQVCNASVKSFFEAKEMMSDEQGNVVQLSDEAEREMLSLIRQGITLSSEVSDEFLDSVHPQMKVLYRNNLVNGWSTYLEGLETQNSQQQIRAIQLLHLWDEFSTKNWKLLSEKLI